MPATIDGMLVDFDLIKRAQNGDAPAFNEVVLAYRKRILGTIARLIARPDDVEDVGQEVFLRLYFSLDQLRTPEVFEPWLYRLTVNAAYDYLRKQRRRMESRMADLSEQQVIMAVTINDWTVCSTPTGTPVWRRSRARISCQNCGSASSRASGFLLSSPAW